MSKLEIRIGGLHHLNVNQTPNIISGEIMKQVGKYYLAYVKDGDYYYHINQSGKVVVYFASDEKIEVIQEIKEGILFISIDLLADIVFLFNGKPIESDLHFYVKDMFCNNPFLIQKDTTASIPYKRRIDQNIDQQLATIAEAEDE